jgi:hypothetical protein
MFSLDNTFVNRNTSSIPTSILDSETFIGRVVDIVLDSSHPDYENYGLSDSIGLIKFAELGTQQIEEGEEENEQLFTNVAYPIDRNDVMYPLLNELVLLTYGPSFDVESQSKSSKIYYQTLFSVHNHIHHNALPPTTASLELNLGEGIDEQSKIAPLQPLPGDKIIQGRLGQSIRLSGGLSEKSPWTDEDNKNKPITIIRNGQKEVEDGFFNILEDINEDSTSIFLTSDHTIPLTLVKDKRDSYDEKPERPSDFKGSQLLFNSDRLTLNARKSDILLSSNISIGMNSTTVNIDGEDYICADADKIYLGVKARTNQGANKQPAVLGHRMEAFMQDVLDQLIAMAKSMGRAKTIDGKPVPTINLRGNSAEIVLKQLKRQLNPKGNSNLKSKKLYIE